MSNRFNVDSKGGLQSGYSNNNVDHSFNLPSCGIEDVDRAVFYLFDKELPLYVDSNGTEQKKAVVIFASGEKWALIKKKKEIRDNNGSLILPLVTVGRTNIMQNLSTDVAGRGINQQTGEFTILRRLDKSDRRFQNWQNRLNIKKQKNVAVVEGQQSADQPSVVYQDQDLYLTDADVFHGALLKNDKNKSVYEVLTIPSPQFYSVTYDIVLWTSYVTHMNQLLETIISAQLAQGNAFRLDTDKGYWFVGTLSGEFTNENNFDDAKENRIIKHKFSLDVKAYMIGSKAPGVPQQVRRYVSAPDISFDLNVGPAIDVQEGLIDDPFLGSDDPTLPLDSLGIERQRNDMRRTGKVLLSPASNEANASDPALLSLPRGRQVGKYKKISSIDGNGNKKTQHVRVASVIKSAGETVYVGNLDLSSLDIIVEE
jgi:hypothetical protein